MSFFSNEFLLCLSLWTICKCQTPHFYVLLRRAWTPGVSLTYKSIVETFQCQSFSKWLHFLNTKLYIWDFPDIAWDGTNRCRSLWRKSMNTSIWILTQIPTRHSSSVSGPEVFFSIMGTRPDSLSQTMKHSFCTNHTTQVICYLYFSYILFRFLQGVVAMTIRSTCGSEIWKSCRQSTLPAAIRASHVKKHYNNNNPSSWLIFSVSSRQQLQSRIFSRTNPGGIAGDFSGDIAAYFPGDDSEASRPHRQKDRQ